MSHSHTPSTPLLHIPHGAVIARYAQQPGGAYAVVTVSKRILAPSFYELRHQYTYGGHINGAGGWVILLPKQPEPTQPALF